MATRPTSEGIMAYRGLAQAQRLSCAAELRGLNMWTGAGRSFICFPVSQGRLINVVAFVPSSRDMEETWFAPGDVKTLASEYGGWDAPVQDIIAALDQTFRWGIYDRPPLPYWSRGRVTLLGDAAHPMVPHFGQGAGQAIEDGFALAVLLEHARHDEIPARLQAYQNLRLERTSRVQAASRQAGRFYRSVSAKIPRNRPKGCGNGCRRRHGYFPTTPRKRRRQCLKRAPPSWFTRDIVS